MPAFIDNLAVVYNKKIFDEAGVDYPTDDWTWDDFWPRRRSSTTPTPGSPGSAGRNDDEDTTWRIWPLIWQQGGEIVSEDGESVGFDGDDGEAALDVVAQAAADGSVYIDSTAGSERMQQLFASGKMAMNVADPYTLPEYVDAKVDYGVVSMPSFGDEHDDRRPRHLGDLRQRRGARGGDRVHGLVQRARAAAALDHRGGQPAADHGRRGCPGLRRL